MILLALLLTAQAPQANCAKIRDFVERSICADRHLARTDAEINRLYKKLLSLLNARERAPLRDAQRTFRANLRRECSVEDKDSPCPWAPFNERLEQLQHTLQAAGGLRFITTTKLQEKPIRYADDDSVTGRYTLETEFLQIQKPRTPAERHWNAITRRWFAKASTDGLGDNGPVALDQTDEEGKSSVGINLIAASDELIVTQSYVSTYFTPAAHGQHTSKTSIWSLRLGRGLGNNDILKSSKHLTKLVARGYGKSDGGGCSIPDPLTANLMVTPRGLEFEFDPYELGGYVCAGTSEISWGEARPYLRRLPFDPRKLHAPVSLVR